MGELLFIPTHPPCHLPSGPLLALLPIAVTLVFQKANQILSGPAEQPLGLPTALRGKFRLCVGIRRCFCCLQPHLSLSSSCILCPSSAQLEPLELGPEGHWAHWWYWTQVNNVFSPTQN